MYFITILIISGVLLFLHVTKNPLTLEGKLNSLIQKTNQIMASQAQLAQELRDLKAQNDKARAEVIAKITALEEAIANAGETTPEVDAALAELKASVQTDDDIVPDEA